MKSRIFVFSAICALFFASLAQAQPSGARGDNFIYKVIQNDTLIDLSNRYTHNSENWRYLQDLNQIADPTKLPIGLQLNIPFSLIPVSDANAQVIHINGGAQLNGSRLNSDSVVKEGDLIQTESNSFITLQMPDFSVVMLPGNTKLTVKRLRTFQGTGLIDSILQLDNGQIESVVAPNNTGTGRFEIRTPISVTGVRGTKLRVRTDDNKSLTEITAGLAQLGIDNSDGPNLTQNQGGLFSLDQISPMPSISKLPEAPKIINPQDTSSKRQLWFEPVDDAVSYILTVASDADGTVVANKNIINDSPASYSVPGAGKWYVLIRSVDINGFQSPDAVIEVTGVNILKSGFGLPIKSGYTDNILLSH